MEQVIKQAAGTSGPAAQVIEVQEIHFYSLSYSSVGIDHSAYKRLPVLPCISIYTWLLLDQ